MRVYLSRHRITYTPVGGEAVEGKVWEPVWRETEDELVLEWVEDERR